MSLEEEFRGLSTERLKDHESAVPLSYQGVDKARIRLVLRAIDRETDDMVDVVFALLDNETDSFFTKSTKGTKFNDGATTAHIGCHIGILQRGGNKLDREGRDYWIKPLRELGVVEPVYFDPAAKVFLQGHPVAKSPNLSYSLSRDFVKILLSDPGALENRLGDWIREENIRTRAKLQAKASETAKHLVGTKHHDLVNACRDVYVPNFLPGYRLVFVDVEDGDRITKEEEQMLKEAGIKLTLADSFPDLLLWNPKKDWLWVIEAVTSDGEVDEHKMQQLKRLASDHKKEGIGFTTAYLTWKDAARRQSQFKNLAPDSYVWIGEDPSQQFHVVEMLKRLNGEA